MASTTSSSCGGSSALARRGDTDSEGDSTRPRFLMDFSINKIAKYFRLLGYDTLCDKSIPHSELLSLAAESNRVLVTSSPSLATRVEAHNRAVRRLGQCHRTQLAGAGPERRRVVVAYDSDGDSIYSDASEPDETEVRVILVRQWTGPNFNSTMVELIRQARLAYDSNDVFSRCVLCNLVLQPVNKAAVRDRVEPRIYAVYEEFTECAKCHHVFWGIDADRVVNYKSYRTLANLRSLCRSAGAPVRTRGRSLSSLQSFRSFPRAVKVAVFSFLPQEELMAMRVVFPALEELIMEVLHCRQTGGEVRPFREVKTGGSGRRRSKVPH